MAALLIGATYPQVRAVVSVVGSGIVTQGISQDVLSGSFLDIMRTPVASWTYQGRELPYLPNVVTPGLEALVAAGEPVPLRLAFEPCLAWSDRVAAATIPVERIAGAVLLLSTEDDQGYGVAFHRAAADRLAAHRPPGEWRHIVYPGAGHNIAAPPYGPTTVSLSSGPGVTFAAGGTARADAKARAGAWTQTLRFLAENVGVGCEDPGAGRTAD